MPCGWEIPEEDRQPRRGIGSKYSSSLIWGTSARLVGPRWAAPPLPYPQFRKRAACEKLAASTIANALRAILIFQLFLYLRGINWEARLDDSQALSIQEVEDLISVCRLPTETLFSLIGGSDDATEPETSHASNLSCEKHRGRASKPVAMQISPAAATRLQSIRDYVT